MAVWFLTMTPNPSINTDWRDKAAPAGYVKRYASFLADAGARHWNAEEPVVKKSKAINMTDVQQ